MNASRALGRLLIVSHTPHYRAEGGPVGWGATVREIDHLASLFERVVHLACLHEGSAPASALPYQAANVEVRPVPAAGGPALSGKTEAVGVLPGYAATIRAELAAADVVHVRAPASIALVAMTLLAVRREPLVRWFKYAGSWASEGGQPLSYRLQRWWLRRGLSRGFVTLNGDPGSDDPRLVSLPNPCLEEVELAAGRAAAALKSLSAPVRMVFVGALVEAKGPHHALEAVATLRRKGQNVVLDVVGAGPLEAELGRRAAEHGISEAVSMRGWLPRPKVGDVLERAHFVVLPSDTEGWPKVLGEGMAYGAVPIASAVGSIPYYLGAYRVGSTVARRDPVGIAARVAEYLAAPGRWKAESLRAVEIGPEFGYRTYVERIGALLEKATRGDTQMR